MVGQVCHDLREMIKNSIKYKKYKGVTLLEKHFIDSGMILGGGRSMGMWRPFYIEKIPFSLREISNIYNGYPNIYGNNSYWSRIWNGNLIPKYSLHALDRTLFRSVDALIYDDLSFMSIKKYEHYCYM